MKFGRTGLAVLGLFAVAAIGCPQPTHKKNGGIDETGGEGGDGGGDATGGKGTGGKANTMTGTGGASDTGGSMSTGGATSTGGSSNTGGATSTGGASGDKDSGAPDTGGGMGGAGGGADMAAFTTLYDTLIKPKCGPGCHITGTSGGLGMQTAAMAFTNLVGKASGCSGLMRVTAGDPTKSVLSLIVKGKGVMGCTARPNQMPKGKTALTAAEVQMIDDWITGK